MSVLAAGIILGQLAGAAPPAGDAPVLTLSDRTEMRARTRLARDGVAEDVETTPLASLVVRGRRIEGSLAYAVHFGYLDFAQTPTFIVSQAARLSLGYLATRWLQLYVAGDGSIGEQFTDGLAAPTKLGSSPLPTTTSFTAPLPIINSAVYRAEVGFGYRLDRRWDLGASAMYSSGRGLDDVSRLIMPRYYGPSGTVTLGYQLNRTDRFATAARATYTVTPSLGAKFFNTAVSETWTHAFAERTTGVFGAGVSWQRSRDSSGAHPAYTFFPDAQVGLTHTVPLGFAETLSFQAIGRMGFSYDPVLRTSSPRASAGLTAGWARTQVGASAGLEYLAVLPSNPPRPAARQLSGNALVWYSAAPAVRLETGFRAYFQDLPAGLLLGPGTETNTLQWAVFVAAVLTAPPVQL